MTKSMTEGSPAKLILFFTIPLLIGNLFQQLYNMADALIVGRTIGVNALAAVGCTGSIMFLIIGFAQGFTSGLSIVAAQNYGAGRIDRIRRGVRQCAGISISFSIAIGLVNIFAGRAMVGLFVGDEPAVITQALIYLVINGVSYSILALLFIYRYTLQGLGQSFVPTFAGIMELVMRCLAAIFLVRHFGFAGACLANPLAWLGSCVPLAIAFYMTMRRV